MGRRHSGRTEALHRRNPAVKTRDVLEQAQRATRARQQKERDRQLKVLLNLLAKMQSWGEKLRSMQSIAKFL